MAGSVKVTGPPLRICSRKIGITEPLDPSTFPNRVEAKTGPFPRNELLAAVINRSPMSFDVPMTLVGLTALSELVKITRSTLHSQAASITLRTPRILVWTASNGDRSHRITCLKGRCMKNNIHPFECSDQLISIADVRQKKMRIWMREMALLQKEKLGLVVIKADELAYFVFLKELMDKFASNSSAAARN
jgi:hypothetical protein